ncbi:hypothetical protein BT96DRAFT_998769 [Gymnopus androsaceus JB14]|uniref:Uncharacterized protein n=1 Tax=Gymnopus androsaceus JB14 TaxID=1447944 RepID=A0A6A4H9X8_9AGAR|nr:hypothetical protein BT96DRAFT_998769 [Gymnopus androsaceus JB14]
MSCGSGAKSAPRKARANTCPSTPLDCVLRKSTCGRAPALQPSPEVTPEGDLIPPSTPSTPTSPVCPASPSPSPENTPAGSIACAGAVLTPASIPAPIPSVNVPSNITIPNGLDWLKTAQVHLLVPTNRSNKSPGRKLFLSFKG